MLPKDLDDIFEEYADDYDLYIVKTDYSGDNFIIEFILDAPDINNKGAIFQKWTIIATAPKKIKVSYDFAPFAEIKDYHPLLWEFTDTQCQLYFIGQCKNVEKLFYDLYLTHQETFGKHQCFDVALFKATSYFKPFQYSNGLLTTGSKKLMEKYAACLKKNELDFTILGERPGESENLKVLLMGDTYVIAKDFSFVRQAEGDQT